MSDAANQIIELDALNKNAADLLVQFKVVTYGDLARLSPLFILKQRGSGRKCLNDLRDALARKGLEFSQSASIPPQPRLPIGAPPLMGVYFVRCQEFVKIGHACDIRRRFDQLSLGIPFHMDMAAVIRCPSRIASGEKEAELHGRFRAFHYRGEWFRDEAELRAFVDALQRGEA